jgi:hypothetical protein
LPLCPTLNSWNNGAGDQMIGGTSTAILSTANTYGGGTSVGAGINFKADLLFACWNEILQAGLMHFF